jgi:hypothetical protein
MSREYETISLLWWMMTLLKSGRVYIDVGLVMSRILVRSDQIQKMLGDMGVEGLTVNVAHQISLAGQCRYPSPIR